MPLTDSELLRAFVASSDQSAFAELVGRHVDFVYATAIRQLNADAHRAEDVTQEVFIKLARHARLLCAHPALLGWLHTTTRHAALDAIRREQRRSLREAAAHAMHSNENGGDIDWERLQPVLDEALGELSETDREVVLARYFERQSFAHLAAAHGVSENAVQKRVDRALEKLRAALGRRHITSTGAALGVALAAQPGIAAPAWLAASATKAALTASIGGGAVAGGSFIAFMGTSKITLALAGLLAAGGLGASYAAVRAARATETELAALQQRDASLQAAVRTLELRAQSAVQRVQTAERENARLLALASAKPTEPTAAEEPITTALVNERFKLAQELVRSGDPAAALRELIWCYDIGMPRVPGMSASRTTAAMLFAQLGERHPPALDALRIRGQQARQRAVADEQDAEAVMNYAMINRALKNDAESIAWFDQLPPGDRRRRTLAIAASDHLVENRRYREALEGKPYSITRGLFETLTASRPAPADVPDPAAWQQQRRLEAIARTATDIEILAGTGDLAHARELAERLFAYDGSATTRALVQLHAERAGQPALFVTPPTGNRPTSP